MVCPQETGWIQTPTNHWNRKASEGDDKGRVIQVLERPHPLKKQTPKGAPPGAHPIQRPGPLARHSHQFDNLQVFIFCYWVFTRLSCTAASRTITQKENIG